MRALITGITGFAGGHLAQVVHDRGDELFGVARSRNIDHLPASVSLVNADLRDAEAVNRLMDNIQPDVIYHLAAQAFVPKAWDNPWGTLENNIKPQLNILEAMTRSHRQTRLLVATSNEVYGVIPPDRLPVTEDTPMRPHNPYGVSKAAQDLLALQYHLSHDLDVVRARAFNHIGPRQSPTFVASSFAKQIAEIEAGLSQAVIRVGNLEAQRDFTDVLDIVQAYVLLTDHGTSGEAYNIGTGRAYSIQYLLEVLLGLTTIPISIEEDPNRMRPADIPVIYADNHKIRTQTGWQPAHKFEDSLRRVLDYWRDEIKKNKKNNPNAGDFHE